jgi:hypothetical protein
MTEKRFTPTPGPTLSPTMRQAADFAAAHGGVLVRLPGGFWQRETSLQWDAQGQSFGTKTVEALVRRGVADYTEWRDGRNGRFPVRMTLRGETNPSEK